MYIAVREDPYSEITKERVVELTKKNPSMLSEAYPERGTF
jgi:hypothetical protein